jgi:predicted permease
LTVAATTTVLSLLNAVVLRDAPVWRPAELVSITVTDARTKAAQAIALDTFDGFRVAQHSFSGLAMYSSRVFRIHARNTNSEAISEAVGPSYFSLLAVAPEAGRLLSEADMAARSVPSIVISDRLWRRLFNGDPTAVGEPLTLNGQDVTIVGVTPPGFAGLQMDSGVDLFLPISALPLVSGTPGISSRSWYVVGRLAPGVTLDQARAEVLGRWPAIARSTAVSPAAREEVRSHLVQVESIRAGFFGLREQYGASVGVLVALAVILLAMACVNLTGLVFMRAMRRRQQVAIRRALGAPWPRVVRPLVAESILLALGGLAIALPLTWWATRTIASMASVALLEPFLRPLTPDGRVLAASVAITIATAVAISVLPAWRNARLPIESALRPGRAVIGSSGMAGRLLLVVQIALAMVLLVGAGLFAGTVMRLRANANAVHPGPVLFAKPWRNPGDHGVLGRAYWQELTRRLSTIPGAGRASLSVYFPAYLGYRGSFPLNTFRADAQAAASASGLTELISPGFFETYGVARLQGRDFTWSDDVGAPDVAIVNASAAHALFAEGEADAVGRRIQIRSESQVIEVSIVGIVTDISTGSLRDPHGPIVFRPILQDPARGQFPLVHLQVSGDVRTVRDAYVRTVESSGHQYVPGLFSFDQWVDFALLQERLIADLSASAAGLAMFLGCLGLYGLLAYAVDARVREIGVRLALGATRVDVIRMIIRDGLTVSVAGIAVGVPSAVAAARLARSALYGLAPGDPWTVFGAATTLVVTALVAAWMPARRASNVHPIDALRAE